MTGKKIYSGNTPAVVLQMLEANADSTLDYHVYYRELGEEEVAQISQDHSQMALQLREIELQKKEMMAEFNGRIKALKEQMAQTLTIVGERR